MRRSHLLLSALFALTASACDLLSGPRQAGSLAVSSTGSELVLENTGGRTIYYFTIEQRMAARVLWAPCTDPVRCAGVPPGQRRSLPHDSVAGFAPESEVALVYWWHLEPASGGVFAPDSVRVETVRF
jgi:hypothetical protein